MKDIQVSIRLARSTNNTDDPRDWRLEITDVTSHKTLVRAYLDADDIANLLSARGVGEPGGINASVLEPEQYQTVGQVKWGASLRLARDFDGQGYEHANVRLTNLVENAALYRDMEASDFTVTEHNYGLSLNVHGYADNPSQAYAQAAKAAEGLFTLAGRTQWRLPFSQGGTSFYPNQDGQ